MKKRLSNFFQLLGEDIGIIIFAIILCPLCIWFCINLRNDAGAFEQPTEDDFKWLHEQEQKVREDYENVYSIEGTSIKVQNSEIKVILVSKTDKNYELHITFDKNKKFITSEEICNKLGFRKYSLAGKYEKYGPIIECVFLGMILGMICSAVLNLICRGYAIFRKK